MQPIDCGPCVLRPWRWSDHEALIRHMDNPRIWRNLRGDYPDPYGAAEADDWLRHAASGTPPPWTFAIEVGGEAAGTVALNRREGVERHAAELVYWLGEAHWGKGIASAAARAVTEAALGETELFRVYAHVFAWNPASMRVLEKAGFRREGVLERSAVKDGVVLDRVVFARTRDPGLPYVRAP